MSESWEISASEARKIVEKSPIQKLMNAKKNIMNEINILAQRGDTSYLIQFDYYEVSCLEDWCNIYNWLRHLGYTVEDNSKNKWSPNFYVKW